MNAQIMAGFSGELGKNAGFMRNVARRVNIFGRKKMGLHHKSQSGAVTRGLKTVAGVGAVGGAGAYAVGSMADRTGVEGRKRYTKKLSGPIGQRSNLYANPATYG